MDPNRGRFRVGISAVLSDSTDDRAMADAGLGWNPSRLADLHGLLSGSPAGRLRMGLVGQSIPTKDGLDLASSVADVGRGHSLAA